MKANSYCDQFDNRTQFSYSGLGLTNIYDPQGDFLLLVHGSYGLSSVRSSNYQSGIGYRLTYYTVQSDGRLTRINDPDNKYTDFVYDGSLRLWKITDRLLKTTTLGYESDFGTLVSFTSPLVRIYDTGQDLPLVSRDSIWQKSGVPDRTTSAASPWPIVRPDDVHGTSREPGGNVTRFTVNRFGLPVVSKYPYGSALEITTTVTYNDDGLPTRIINSADAADTTFVQYNTDGLATSVRRSGLTETTITYGAWAQPTLIQGTGQVQRVFWLGTNGRVDSAGVGSGYYPVKTRYTYDTRGRVLTVKDALGNVVQSNTYSGTNGNLSTVSRPGGPTTTYGFDAYGRRTTVAQTGLPTRTTYYDILNRPDSVRDGVNSVATRYGYNALRDTSVTDASGRTFVTVYNDVGWVIQRVDPAGESDSYGYSWDGELIAWTNRRNQQTNYAYDQLLRPVSKSGSHTSNTSFSYSSNGRVITATSAVSTETTYLSLSGQVDSARTVMGGKTYWVRHKYSTAGVLDSTWATSTGSATFLGRRYLWTSDRGRLNELRIGGKSTTLSYNGNQQPTSITYPGGHVVGQQYVTNHSNAKIESNQSALAELVRRLEYDNSGRIRNQYTPPIPVEFGTVLGYDGLNRLVRDTMGMIESDLCTFDSNNGYDCPAPTTDSVRSFVYDPIGNVRRDSIYRVYGADVAVTGSYSDTTGRISAFNGCTYSTDDDGNVELRDCASEDVRFHWSSDNQLVALKVVGGDSVDLYYDALGRLVRRDVDGSIDTYWFWEGSNLFAELNSAGAKVAEYSYWLGGLDRLHALVLDTTVYFAHKDGFGNVVGLVNESKQLKRSYKYDAWGKLVDGVDGASFNDRDRARFKGALWMGDAGADLYYMRNRWYEPATSRFLSEDPIGLAGGINLYAFAGNNPISGRDPTGLIDRNHDGGGGTWSPYDRLWIADSYIDMSEPDWPDWGDGGVGGGGGGGGRGEADGQEKDPICRFSPGFLQMGREQLEMAGFEGLERGGWYGAPWLSPLRMTATHREPRGLRIPMHPGASGYWHTHQNPGDGRPGLWDKYFAMYVTQSTEVVFHWDFVFVIDPRTGGVTACSW